MRSDTIPTWVGFTLGFGIALVIVAVFALAKGEMKLVSSITFRRDAQPGAYWAAVILSAVIGLATLAYAIPHFRPGG
jgi:ABC-type antimicrobial peptide transport system permease subunit